MSEVHGRETPGHPALLDYVASLQARNPDGPLPDGGRPFPDAEHFAALPSTGKRYSERKQHLIDVVTGIYEMERSPVHAGLLLDEALAQMRVDQRVAVPLSEVIASFDPVWRRHTGRHLAYRSSERSKVAVGLALLSGAAQSRDAVPVRLLGLLGRHFGDLAIRVLRQIPGAASDLLWLADKSGPVQHSYAVESLCELADPATFDWLFHRGVRLGGPSMTVARKVAETVDLAGRLDYEAVDEHVVEQAGRLLLAMSQRGSGNAELRKYADAQPAISRLAAHAQSLNPTLDRYALLVALLAELSAGQCAVLRWRHGPLDLVVAPVNSSGVGRRGV